MLGPFPHANLRGELHRLSVDAPSLHGNYWSDPTQRDVWAFVPPEMGSEPLPMVIFLAGFAGTGEIMLGRNLTRPSRTTMIDHWWSDGSCPPFVAVFPDCMTSLGGSQFVNSPAIGRYADYVLHDVVTAVRQRFSCRPELGIVGHSSGGFGALRLAMDFPGSVQAIACHAGDMGFDIAFVGELTQALLPLHEAGDPRAFLRQFWQKSRFAPAEFAAFNVLCMSAAYSPNLEESLFPDFPADLPISLTDGRINWKVFDRWLEHDPLRRIEHESAQQGLRALRYCYIDVGSSDEYLLQFGARQLTSRLLELGIPHHFEEFAGGHRNTSHRLNHSVPDLVRHLLDPK